MIVVPRGSWAEHDGGPSGIEAWLARGGTGDGIPAGVEVTSEVWAYRPDLSLLSATRVE